MIKRIFYKYLSRNRISEESEITNLSDFRTELFPYGIYDIRNTKDQDVFIVGFPKSGNTLMQHVISHLVYGLNDEVSETIINLIVPDIYANKFYFRPNEINYFKSHELPCLKYKKVIYIVRDGRSALFSYYKMMQAMGKSVSIDSLYRGEIKILDSLWHEHVESWVSNPYNSEMLIIKYEDLVSSKMKTLYKICNFLSIERTESQLKEVSYLTSLKFMKSIELKSDWAKRKELTNFSLDRSFIRKGKVGEAAFSDVDENLIEEFELYSYSTLKKFNYL